MKNVFSLPSIIKLPARKEKISAKQEKTASFRDGFGFQSLFAEGAFRGGDQGSEGFRVVDRDFGEHLAVDGDVALLEAVHEDGVGDVVDSASGIDAADPEFAVVSLDKATGDIGITEGVKDLFLRGFEQKMLGTEVAFGHLQDLFATGTGNGATFNS